MAGLPTYGTVPLPLGSRQGRVSAMKARLYALAAACVVVVVLIAIAASSSLVSIRRPSALLMAGMNDLDKNYLSAEVKGESGKDLIKRLQEIWFVGAHNEGLKSVSDSANVLITELVSAGFPDDVKSAISGATNPCEDFYEFACGQWNEDNRNKIPAYKSSVGLAWDTANKRVKTAMTELLESDDGPAGTYWKSCMDEERIEKAGGEVLKPWLAVIDGIEDKASLVSAVVTFNQNNQDTLFSWYVDRDPANDQQHAFFLTQSSTSMPDKTYYTEDSDEMKDHRAKLEERITFMLGLIHRPEPAAEAKLVMELETTIAEAMEDRTESRQDHGTVTSWEEVASLVPNWPWHDWLNALASCTPSPDGGPQPCKEFHTEVAKVGGEGGKPLLMRNKGFFSKLDNIIKTTPLETVKALMRWKLVKGSAPSMSAEFLDALVVLNRDIYGIQEKSPRPRKCYFSTLSTAGWPAAKIYADKVFHRGNIDAAKKMLANIRTKFDSQLMVEPWMAPEDRIAAQAKLANMFFQVGVPTNKEGEEHWPAKTTELEGMMGPGLFENECISSRLQVQRTMLQLTEVPDRRHWGGSTPMAVNAFYGPSNNGLWIPAGILQAPFFDESMEDARNYGSIGAVLGHEMSHGFDDNGRQYNARGELQDWWSPATVEGFKKGSGCISKLFSSYSISGRHVQGDLTLGEDIADSGGLKFSFQAFGEGGQRSDEDKRLFFTAFAQTWCQVSRRKSAVASMLSDVHAPAKFRVLGALSQFPPFQEAFACPAGSPMAPVEQCKLW